MNEFDVTVKLTPAELKRLINALHDLIDAEHKSGKEPSESDQELLMKLAESF